MNWLILTNHTDVARKLSSIIFLREKGANVHTYSIGGSVTREWAVQLREISNVIIVANENEIEKTEVSGPLMALSGYCISERITLFTNLKTIDDLSIGSKDPIYYFEDIEAIANELNTNYFYLAGVAKKREAAKSLLELGVPFTPACFAAYITDGKFEICRQFLDAGMDINVRDDSGTPMINVAMRTDNEEIVSWLVDNGADINVKSADRGYTPLMDAVWRGNYEMVKFLIKKGADVNTISKEGQSNLVLAVGANQVAIVSILAESHADPDVKDQMGMSAYEYAKLFKKEEIVEILEPYHKTA